MQYTNVRFKGKNIHTFTKLILIFLTSLIFSCKDTTSPAERSIEAKQGLDLISYKVLSRSELSTFKVSYNIEVPLVNNKLPTAKQMGDISNYLISKEPLHEKSFVIFLLPQMVVGNGAYASAHHTPEMKVEIMEQFLFGYEEYHHFIPEIVNILSK